MTRFQSTIGSGEGYDEVRYRESLRTLGLFAPVTKDDIQKAYRSRAKEYHPDQFIDNGEKVKATERIQEINAAHEYALKRLKDDKPQAEHESGMEVDPNNMQWQPCCNPPPIAAPIGLQKEKQEHKEQQRKELSSDSSKTYAAR